MYGVRHFALSSESIHRKVQWMHESENIFLTHERYSQERVGKIYYMDQNIQFLVEVKTVLDLKDMCQLQV